MNEAKQTNQLGQDLGPWKENPSSFSVDYAAQLTESMMKKTNLVRLPRMITRSLRPKNQSHFPMNITHLKLDESPKKTHSPSHRQTKTISFDSPLIRFFSRNQRTHQSTVRYNDDPSDPEMLLSKIEIADIKKSQDLQRHKSKDKKPRQKQFTRKRSLIQILKYMKNQSYQAPIFSERPRQKRPFEDEKLISYSCSLKSRYSFPVNISLSPAAKKASSPNNKFPRLHFVYEN